ncbi:hypothetical protein FQA39_LY14879 [Lamprigera yunnana]|nr:hypothetical protein FQA39_LY14879 [Lamprigera yunnana]
MHYFVYFALIAVAYGAPRSEPVAQKNGVEVFIQQLDNVRKDIDKSIQKVLPDSKEVTNTLIDISKTFAAAVEKGAKDLSQHVDKNKETFDVVVRDVSKGISESVNYINSLTNEEVAKKAEEIKQTLKVHIDNILKGGKQIEEAVAPSLESAQKQFKTYSTSFIKNVADASEHLKEELDKILTKKQNN